jgi:hypothetical protein
MKGYEVREHPCPPKAAGPETGNGVRTMSVTEHTSAADRAAFLHTYATERAKRANTLADAADDPRDKAAFRAAARAWESIAGPGVAFSLEPMKRELAQLKRDTAAATGPFSAPVARPQLSFPEAEETAYDREPVSSINF